MAIPTRGRDIDDRIRDTYFLAMEQASACGAVTVHVGQEVWDEMRARMETATGFAPLLPSTLFGFPILLEAAWEPTRLEVRTTRVIP